MVADVIELVVFVGKVVAAAFYDVLDRYRAWRRGESSGSGAPESVDGDRRASREREAGDRDREAPKAGDRDREAPESEWVEFADGADDSR